VNNPRGNIWDATKTKAKISANGLEAVNKDLWHNVYSLKGFDISGKHSGKDNLLGTFVYYYEVKQTDYAWIKLVN
jgi:hypothetical protein